jgi:hypothetical protein
METDLKRAIECLIEKATEASAQDAVLFAKAAHRAANAFAILKQFEKEENK